MSLWIAHAERTISDEIPAPPDEVRDFYVDLDNIKDLHPLVVSVQLLEHTKPPRATRRPTGCATGFHWGRYRCRSPTGRGSRSHSTGT